jgi:C_GCAxxG_C_C family probable redox protein
VCQEFEIETGNDVIPRIASAFGGGIGNTGSVCGAVIGAIMAIGLKMERGKTLEDWLRIAGTTQEFRRRFEAEMGTIYCRELTGVDLTTEEGLKQLMDTSQNVCFPAVGTAYRLVLDLFHETK